MDGTLPKLDRPDLRSPELFEGGYEIRNVPTSFGEPSTPGGAMPREPFQRLYEEADRV